MRCPHHDKELESRHAGDHVADCCPVCNGLWLPATAVHAVLGRRLTLDIILKQRACFSGVYCPEDLTGLEELQVRGVTIDWCPRCSGLWFDKGELTRLLLRWSQRPKLGLARKPDNSPGHVLVDVGGEIIGDIGATIVIETLSDLFGGL